MPTDWDGLLLVSIRDSLLLVSMTHPGRLTGEWVWSRVAVAVAGWCGGSGRRANVLCSTATCATRYIQREWSIVAGVVQKPRRDGVEEGEM